MRERLERKVSLGCICEEICNECLAPDTDNDGAGCDNMTMMVIRFSAAGEAGSTGCTVRKRPAPEELDADHTDTARRKKGSGDSETDAGLRS